ncbi:MAG: hypothetical protein HYV17_14020 [Xanthomonadales bacterium]|nr:hypothetical protein [Xanthomonadales bacterium]
MIGESHQDLTFLRNSPTFLGGAAVALTADVWLFGALYLPLLIGTLAGIGALAFLCLSVWRRESLYQTLGFAVVAGAVAGMRGDVVSSIQVVLVALAVVALPLTLLRRALLRRAGHGQLSFKPTAEEVARIIHTPSRGGGLTRR